SVQSPGSVRDGRFHSAGAKSAGQVLCLLGCFKSAYVDVGGAVRLEKGIGADLLLPELPGALRGCGGRQALRHAQRYRGPDNTSRVSVHYTSRTRRAQEGIGTR